MLQEFKNWWEWGGIEYECVVDVDKQNVLKSIIGAALIEFCYGSFSYSASALNGISKFYNEYIQFYSINEMYH